MKKGNYTYTKVKGFTGVYFIEEKRKYVFRLVIKKEKYDKYSAELFSSPKAAADALAVEKYKRGILEKPISEDITWGDMWAEILKKNDESGEYKSATITKYNSIYEHHIKKRWEKRKISSLSIAEYNTLLLTMYNRGEGSHGYSWSFTRSIYKYLFFVLGKARDAERISEEYYSKCFHGIKLPEKTKQSDIVDIRILDEEQIKKIYDLLRGTDYELPFLLSLTCGLRPGEIYALTWKDIDLDKKTLTVNKQLAIEDKLYKLRAPKTQASKRTIAISDELAYILYEWRETYYEKKDSPEWIVNRGKIVYAFDFDESIHDEPDFVCRSSDGKRVLASGFEYYARIIRKDICPKDYSLEDFSFYTFRKTCLSNMAQKLPVQELTTFAGHSNAERIIKNYYSSPKSAEKLTRETQSQLFDLLE